MSKIYPTTEYTLYFDGCSKGNPGNAGAGCVLFQNGKELWSKTLFVGHSATNNQAEYTALILGLECALEKNIRELTVYGDSLLVINQVTNKFKVNSNNLISLHHDAKALISKFELIQLIHIPRELNKRADQLSNEALLRS